MVRITKDIHIAVFCDAGIDHEKIVSGKDISPFANMLRYIYLVPELQNKVKFYKSNQEIEAPWKQQPEVWRTCTHIFNSGLVVDHDYVGKGIESGGKGNDSNKLGSKKDHFNTSMNKVLLHDKSIEPNQYPINGFGEICRLKKEREKVKISFSNEYCEAFLAALTKSLENMGGGVSGKPFASNSANGSNGNFDIQDLLLKYFTKEQKSYPYWNNFFQVIAYYEQFNLQQLSSYDIDKLPQLLKNSEWRISLDMVNLCQNERICFICEKNYDFDNCVIKGNTYSKLANAMRYVYHHPTLKEKVRFYDGENFFEAPWEKNQLAWGKCLKKFYSDLSISTLLYGHSSNGQKAQNQISKLIEEKKVEFELKPLIQPHYSSDKKQINELRGRKLDVIVEEQENNTKKTGKTTNLKLYKSQKYRATR